MKLKVGDRIRVLVEHAPWGAGLEKGDVRRITSVDDWYARTKPERGDARGWCVPRDTEDFGGRIKLLPRAKKTRKS